MEKILVIGATSAIAQAVCRLLAPAGAGFCLVGRDEERLGIVADDLLARGAAGVSCRTLDFGLTGRFEDVVSGAMRELDGLTVLLVAHGTLTDEARARVDVAYLAEQMMVNFTSAAAWVTIVANRFEQERRGKIVVLGSVAGDRGRRSNYVYGTAKGSLATFMQGLRHRLAGSGVQALLIKPGFVDTPMTAGLRKNFLYSTPERIARDIVRAMAENKRVVYSPWYWRYILLLIRLIPEALFNRTRL